MISKEDIELTPEDIKNGWDKETLWTYIQGRQKAQADHVLHREPQRPKYQNNSYNPHKWRA